MAKKQVIRVVLASPGDVGRERRIIQETIDELNTGLSRILGVELELSRWETDTYPAFHLEGSQAHIESVLRIEDCDLLLCLFGRRFGSPTKYAESGTESEFRRAYNAWRETGKPQIMMYFKKFNIDPHGEESETQWIKLQNFRATLPPEGLFWEYETLPALRRLVRQHLTLYLSQTPAPVIYRAPLSKFTIVTREHSLKYYDVERQEYHIRATKALRRPGSDLRLPLLDFDCELTLRKVSGSDKSWFGFYIVRGRGSDTVTYHDFFISGKGTFTYEIKEMNATEDQQKRLEIIQPAQLGISIKIGNSSNRMRLIRRGSIIEFKVNGQSLLEARTSLEDTEKVQVGIAVHAERDLDSGNHIEVAFKDWVFYGVEAR